MYWFIICIYVYVITIVPSCLCSEIHVSQQTATVIYFLLKNIKHMCTIGGHLIIDNAIIQTALNFILSIHWMWISTKTVKCWCSKINSYPHMTTSIKKITNKRREVMLFNTVIDALKSHKSPGVDSIPAEFIKSCKSTLSETITIALNYIIEHRDFPQTWASGICSAVFKMGKDAKWIIFGASLYFPWWKKYLRR